MTSVLARKLTPAGITEQRYTVPSAETVLYRIYEDLSIAVEDKFDDEELDDDACLLQAANVIGKSLEQTDTTLSDKLTHVGALIFIALYAKPENAQTASQIARSKKYRFESTRDQAFGAAVKSLGRLSSHTPNRRERESALIIAKASRQSVVRGVDTERLQVAVDDVNRGELPSFAGNMLRHVLNEKTTSEAFGTEIDAWHMRAYGTAMADEQTEPEMKETHWTILPPDTLQQLLQDGHTEQREGEPDPLFDASVAETIKLVFQNDRIKKLARFALEWGDGAYIAIANLDNTGGSQYRAAILPDRSLPLQPNGEPLAHAFADNPREKKHAAFLFRAETGMNPQDEILYTWKDVFSGTKDVAKGLGARRLLHVGDLDGRVLEALTAPTSKLSRRR
jgi:hypothetical protein